MKKWIN